jgi:hypothetical protein
MKHYSLITAAAIAAGGLTFAGCDRNETASNKPATTGQTAGDKVERTADRAGEAIGNAVDNTKEAGKEAGAAIANAADKAGDKIADATHRAADKTKDATDDARQAGARLGAEGKANAPDAEGIRDVLASATEAALTEKGLNDLTERLVDADRNHIGKDIGKDFPDHTALVKQFRADWKAKYGQDFDVKERDAYPDALFTISQSEVGAAAPSGTEVATGQKAGDLDANREKGRNIATVSVAESHGLPSLSVPLVHEAIDAWKIDAPDSLTAQKLHDNVMAHLKAAHDMKDQWPADVNQAYAAVTHHVLMAILDQPVQQK